MNAYSVMVAIGAGLGLAQVYQAAPRQEAGRWINSALLVLFCSLFGARLGFVLMHTSYFSLHPLEIPRFELGGLFWGGAAAGALLGLLILWVILGGKTAGMLDGLALLAPPLAVCAWLGSWQVGSTYGVQVLSGTWWGIPGLDEAGNLANRWPVQPLAALSLLVTFALLQLTWKKTEEAGRLAGMIGLVLALNLLVFSLFIAEPAPLWRGLRPDTWSAIGLGAISLIGLLAALIWPSKQN